MKSRIFNHSAPHGMGLAASSTQSTLFNASEFYLRHNQSPTPLELIDSAVGFERFLAGGNCVAAADVAAIVEGGVVLTKTEVNGAIDVTHVEHDPSWIEQHVVLGIKPNGDRHVASKVLSGLFDCVDAKKSVRRLSQIASAAAESLRNNSLDGLGNAVNQARRVFFDDWAKGELSHPDTVELANSISKQLGQDVVGWKHLGAGSASSVLFVTRDRVRTVVAMKQKGWEPLSPVPSPGIQLKRISHGIRFEAPCRINFVGAADLGQDPKIGVDGLCCSVAIRPVSSVDLFFS